MPIKFANTNPLYYRQTSGNVDIVAEEITFGQAWIYLGLLRFHLLLPSSPLDPACIPSIKHHWFTFYKAESILSRTVVESQERYYPLGAPHTSLQAYKDKISTVDDQIETQYQRFVTRPGVAYSSFYAELLSFTTSMVNTERMMNWMLMLSPNASMSSTSVGETVHQVQNWKASVSGFVNRMTSTFEGYDDILDPLLVSLYHIQEGFNILLMTSNSNYREKESIVSSDKNLCDTAKLVAAYPTSISWSTLIHQLFKVKPTSIASRMSIVQSALSALELSHMEQHSDDDDHHQSSSTMVFDAIVEWWYTVQEQNKAKEIEKAQLYKYKQVTVEIESEEEQMEKAYQLQFPNHAAVFEENDTQMNHPMEMEEEHECI